MADGKSQMAKTTATLKGNRLCEIELQGETKLAVFTLAA
jgi:hypothetical protein